MGQDAVPPSGASEPPPRGDRLESWKEIAAHLNRGVSTVQRWERQEGLPVHRHRHNRLGSVWASRAEVDAWWRDRQAQLETQPENGSNGSPVAGHAAWRRWALGGAGLVVAALAVWILRRPVEPSPAPGPLVPLTSLHGREFDPALSPDGTAVAFIWDEGRGQAFGLHVLRPGLSAPQRLAEAEGSVCCPAWSPDGRHIAFIRQSGPEAQILVVDARGGGERSLGSLQTWFGTGLAWSPDGKSLAYPNRRGFGEPFTLVVLQVETGEARIVTRAGPRSLGDAFPAYADDGTLAFSRVSAEGDALPSDIYLLPPGAAEPGRLTQEPALIGGVAWLPGAREIVYSAVRPSQSPALFRVSARGGPPTLIEGALPSETVAESASAISHALRLSSARRTRQIAYVRRSYDTNIWRLPAPADSTSSPTRLIASTRTDEAPQYSPDGSRIAFASTRTGPSEIWVCGREGTDCAPQTRAGVHSGTPRWSPDGRYIAYDSRPEGQSDVFVLELDTGTVARVTSSPAEDVVPSFSRDSRFVYFASIRSGAWQVYRARLDGSELRQVTTGGGFAAFEGEDGVYFTRQDVPGLWRVPVSGGLGSKERDTPSCWGHWALAQTGVFLLEAQPGLDTAIDFLDFRSGRTSRLHTLPQAAPCAESSLAVSPDGRELLYVAVEDGSDIMGFASPD